MKLAAEEIENRVNMLVQDLELCGIDSDLERRVIEAHVIKWHEDSIRDELRKIAEKMKD